MRIIQHLRLAQEDLSRYSKVNYILDSNIIIRPSECHMVVEKKKILNLQTFFD